MRGTGLSSGLDSTGALDLEGPSGPSPQPRHMGVSINRGPQREAKRCYDPCDRASWEGALILGSPQCMGGFYFSDPPKNRSLCDWSLTTHAESQASLHHGSAAFLASHWLLSVLYQNEGPNQA